MSFLKIYLKFNSNKVTKRFLNFFLETDFRETAQKSQPVQSEVQENYITIDELANTPYYLSKISRTDANQLLSTIAQVNFE